MQLVAPVFMLAMLDKEALRKRRGKRHLAAILPHRASQNADRVILLFACAVEPFFNRDRREAHVASADRMSPGLFGKRTNCRLELTARRG